MNTATPINTNEVRDAYIAYFHALANKAEKSPCHQCGVTAKLTPYAKSNRTGLELCRPCLEGATCS